MGSNSRYPAHIPLSKMDWLRENIDTLLNLACHCCSKDICLNNYGLRPFFTSNFLSNLLPTSVHDKMLSPFEVLHGKSPVYTALQVFGSACYPYLRPYAQNKFDPKSLLCVFLGYNEKYKGYRCFHPPSGRVYISVDMSYLMKKGSLTLLITN